MRPQTVTRWDGREIHGARSVGDGVFAAYDWRDLVLETGEPIEGQARVASAQARAFAETDRVLLERCDGRYCDLQSIRSEDTVTWSVFGVYSVELWASELLTLAFGEADRPTTWRSKFWKRLPHPNTGSVEHGPEADLTLEADGDWFYAVEAKWLSDLAMAQGSSRRESQLQMRAASVAARASAEERRGVLVVALGPSIYPATHRPRSTFSRYFQIHGDGYRPLAEAVSLGAVAITWEQIASLLTRRPEGAEVVKYLRWRMTVGL